MGAPGSIPQNVSQKKRNCLENIAFIFSSFPHFLLFIYNFSEVSGGGGGRGKEELGEEKRKGGPNRGETKIHTNHKLSVLTVNTVCHDAQPDRQMSGGKGGGGGGVRQLEI